MNEFLKQLAERLRTYDSEIITADELAGWPEGKLDELISEGILTEIEHSNEIVCDQCEQNCSIEPTIRTYKQGGKTQAIGVFVCTRRDDIGRITVDLNRLRQWRINKDKLRNERNKQMTQPSTTNCVRPTIVCLCGSTRFKEAFDEANYQETMAGKIVLSVGFFMHYSNNCHGQNIGATPNQKIALDELHLRKIDLADEVLILNVGGYIGESTRRELEYARKIGKPIRFLE